MKGALLLSNICFWRFLLSIFEVVNGISVEEYSILRENLIQREDALGLGAGLKLDALETRANRVLMKFKAREFREGLGTNGALFPPAQHFFHAKDAIEGSNVFKIIQILPKGAALHMHDFTVGPAEFVAHELTKWDNLYYCNSNNMHLLFQFSETQPTEFCHSPKPWELVSEFRKNASSLTHVDAYFLSSMSMLTPTPDVDYPDTDHAWAAFEKKITTISTLVNYEKAFRAFYYETLKQFYEDNVMYIEMRGLFDSVYRLDGTLLTPLEVVGLYKEVTREFMKDHPAFWGAKVIYAPHRFHQPEDVELKLKQALEMKDTYPNFFAGFDLVGQEDKGGPLSHFLPQLLEAKNKGVQFFFHAGETDWLGTAIDENLYDAVLLNSSRIGHGYAIANYPILQELAKERGIGIEVCPISNQLLNFVKDVRNHPSKALLQLDYPVVIASDGPGIWGSKALSHDFYYAFMAMGGARADLRFLKQLAINSITFSAMSSSEKNLALGRFHESWIEAIDYILEIYEIK